jgi:hypothetical protein
MAYVQLFKRTPFSISSLVLYCNINLNFSLYPLVLIPVRFLYKKPCWYRYRSVPVPTCKRIVLHFLLDRVTERSNVAETEPEELQLFAKAGAEVFGLAPATHKNGPAPQHWYLYRYSYFYIYLVTSFILSSFISITPRLTIWKAVIRPQVSYCNQKKFRQM